MFIIGQNVMWQSQLKTRTIRKKPIYEIKRRLIGDIHTQRVPTTYILTTASKTDLTMDRDLVKDKAYQPLSFE